MELSAIVDWLSSPENPPVRYLTALNLTKKKPSQRALKSMKQEMLAWDPLRKILAMQLPDGSFPVVQKEYKAEPTCFALCLMERCGMDIKDEPVARTLDYLTKNHIGNGAFSYTGGGSGILPCYAGIFTRAVIRMAGHEHPASRANIQWILDYQRFDHKKTRAGGPKTWPFKVVDNYGGCWWSVSCYHGVVGTLGALAAIPPDRRSSTVKSRLKAAIRYLKIHRVYKRSSLNKPLFRHMTQFFLFGAYRSHLIDVLEHIADAQPGLIREKWVQDAVEDVEGLVQDGKVILVKNYRAKLIDPLPFEPVGKPSRFLTYQWLNTKRKFGLE